MSLLPALLLSLALTVLLELAFARLWGEPLASLRPVALANAISNPMVVLFHRLFLVYLPPLLLPATALLEIAACTGEGWFYRRYTAIRHPWGFSLCANLFSFCIGLLLSAWRSLSWRSLSC